MKNRNPIAVALLPFITFGIYSLYWEVKTKGEMNKLGAKIPTAWLIIIPLVNIWWLWKYCEGVEEVTGNKMSGILAFVLIFLLGVIGAAIIQNEFNKVGDQPAAAQPMAPTPPAPGFGAPQETTPASETPQATPVAAAPVPAKPVEQATPPVQPVEQPTTSAAPVTAAPSGEELASPAPAPAPETTTPPAPAPTPVPQPEQPEDQNQPQQPQV